MGADNKTTEYSYGPRNRGLAEQNLTWASMAGTSSFYPRPVQLPSHHHFDKGDGMADSNDDDARTLADSRLVRSTVNARRDLEVVGGTELGGSSVGDEPDKQVSDMQFRFISGSFGTIASASVRANVMEMVIENLESTEGVLLLAVATAAAAAAAVAGGGDAGGDGDGDGGWWKITCRYGNFERLLYMADVADFIFLRASEKTRLPCFASYNREFLSCKRGDFTLCNKLQVNAWEEKKRMPRRCA
ncbi:hypothetical protein HZH68_003819 [Vespula germanica]|uniref:Uncharacterized protein n=1 Tax=Vespula germanica TaxID=30212 RepID=A0A834KMH8_VESGE|nr:hypothetical protein HZH68_003819 [Vespula germanica]